MPDVKRLIAEVASRNGIRIDPDDPAFCLVTLNQLILEEAGEKLAAEVRTATKEFEDAVHRVEGRVGVILGRQLKETLTSLRHNGAMADRRQARRTSAGRLAICIISAALIFICGVMVGMALH
jgi:hypothetical protein